MQQRKMYVRLMGLMLALLLSGCGNTVVPVGTEYTPDYTVLEGKTDLMATALENAGFDEFSGFTAQTRGVGTFADYERLHANPLDTADYALGLRKLSEQIQPDTTGLKEFTRDVTEQYGFQTAFAIPDARNGSFPEAVEAFFLASGKEADPKDAIAFGDRLTEETKDALTDYLWAASAALEQNRQACAGTEILRSVLAGFRMTAPATDDVSAIRRAYRIWDIVDEEALLASGQQMIAASAQLVRKLSAVEKLTQDGSAVSVETPAGRIIIGSTGDDRYENTEAFLHIDPGGNDTYEGSVAASTAACPISVLIDLGGNDSYHTDNGPAQGCGVLGTGLLYDMEGDDRYDAGALSQGAAHIGTGMLFDANGNDFYTATTSCQGSATYGFALNIDMAGDDRYYARGYAQAYAGNRGMSLLINGEGGDEYYVEPLVEKGWEELAYDQFPEAAGNWSQGCGAGNRSYDPEGKRGLSGGVAALIDLGNQPDRYTGGIWVMGVGYWSGVGLLLDSGGADVYDSGYYCQGSVAHCGAGMMLDMGDGNDVHRMRPRNNINSGQGAALGFTWDYGTALFVNEAGQDVYIAQNFACGVSWAAYDPAGPEEQKGSYAIFLDCSGNDTYSGMSEPAYGYGKGGFFLDLAGADIYGQNGRRNHKEYITNGGVFLDHRQEDIAGAAFFWEKARIKYGY